MVDERSMQDRVRRRVVYKGRVQGVGFRFTTANIARRFPIVGYVRNQSDATVDVVAEGTDGTVADFLREIEEAFEGYITGRDETPCDSSEKYSDFRVRY